MTDDFITDEIDEVEVFEQQTTRPLPQKDLKLAVAESIDHYEDMLNGGRTGLYTGIKSLDALSGGLKPGNLVVVAARTGGYKTTFALNIARHVAHTEQVALFSLEMSKQEILNLLFSMVLQIDRNHFNTGSFTPEEMDRMSSRRDEIERLKLSIFRDVLPSADGIRGDCVSLSCDEPIGLIVVDYLQLMIVKGWKGNREGEVAMISHGLKRLAMEMQCPVIALSQLNEEGLVRDSRAIAHDADIVLLLEEGVDVLEVKIDKGRTVRRGKFTLNLIDEFCRIENALLAMLAAVFAM
jgi:replicative DNA helicase